MWLLHAEEVRTTETNSTRVMREETWLQRKVQKVNCYDNAMRDTHWGFVQQQRSPKRSVLYHVDGNGDAAHAPIRKPIAEGLDKTKRVV